MVSMSLLFHIHDNRVPRWADQGSLRAYHISSRGDRRFKPEDITGFVARPSASEKDGIDTSLTRM